MDPLRSSILKGSGITPVGQMFSNASSKNIFLKAGWSRTMPFTWMKGAPQSSRASTDRTHLLFKPAQLA